MKLNNKFSRAWQDFDFTFAFISGILPLLGLVVFWLDLSPEANNIPLEYESLATKVALAIALPALLLWLPSSYVTLDKRKPGHLSLGFLLSLLISTPLFVYLVF